MHKFGFLIHPTHIFWTACYKVYMQPVCETLIQYFIQAGILSNELPWTWFGKLTPLRSGWNFIFETTPIDFGYFYFPPPYLCTPCCCFIDVWYFIYLFFMLLFNLYNFQGPIEVSRTTFCGICLNPLILMSRSKTDSLYCVYNTPHNEAIISVISSLSNILIQIYFAMSFVFSLFNKRYWLTFCEQVALICNEGYIVTISAMDIQK